MGRRGRRLLLGMIKTFGTALVWDMGRRIAARRGYLSYSAGYMMGGSFVSFIIWRIAVLGFRIETLYIYERQN
jgi:hypothetical protein